MPLFLLFFELYSEIKRLTNKKTSSIIVGLKLPNKTKNIACLNSANFRFKLGKNILKTHFFKFL